MKTNNVKFDCMRLYKYSGYFKVFIARHVGILSHIECSVSYFRSIELFKHGHPIFHPQEILRKAGLFDLQLG